MKPTLRGKTIVITGSSRGIGKAIALRAARDGANIVLVAKTVEPHPRLPGTIHSAAAEVEAAGGRALAVAADIRFEDEVKSAVEKAVEVFGGVDILVNNASAIHLAGTLEMDMKRYDLIQDVNVRGTFLCSRLCLPHLMRAPNPHILNLSPPVSLAPRWLGPHIAYTISKYGMSLCALGMAEEFRQEGVAVNALWPKTAIATAAVQNLLGGEAAIARCRKPEILADAAHWILTRSSRDLTGQLLLDEDVLRLAGVKDLEAYSVTPGADLLPDLFV